MAVRLLFVLSLVLASPVYAEENSLPRHLPPTSYQILDTGFFARRSALRKKLDEASTQGYRVVGGCERVLVVRKAHGDQRYVSVAAGGGDIGSLEREMNAAAAAGFRLVPEAVLGSLAFAVMEKRVGASPAGVDYRLLSFEGDHEIYPLGPGLAVGGGFDAEAIDERLAELAIGGYHVVAVATQNIEVRKTREPLAGGLLGKLLAIEKYRLHQQLIMFFEKDTDVRPAGTVREAARRYHAVIAATEVELEAGLNRAAEHGYRLATTAANAFPQMIALVEKQAPATSRPTYAVFASNKLSSLTDDLSRLAAAGWIVHSRGVLNPSGGRSNMLHVLLVLEREPSAMSGTFLVLDAVRSSTLAKELNQATAAGFELIAGGEVGAGFELVVGNETRGVLLLVLRRAVSGPREILRPRYRRLSDGSWPSSGAPVPDEPRNSLRPSAKVASRPLPFREPVFARKPSTTISMPGGSDCFDDCAGEWKR